MTVPLPMPLDPDVIVNHVGVLLVAIHVHAPPFAVTPTVPLPAAALGDALVASSVKLHGAAACVTVNDWPAIVSVPVLGVVLRFAVYEYVTVALPVPLVPDVTVNHVGASLVAVHAQVPTDAVTPTVPVPAVALGDALVASRVKLQVAPACVTVNVWPATVSVPIRGVAVGFVVTA